MKLTQHLKKTFFYKLYLALRLNIFVKFIYFFRFNFNFKSVYNNSKRISNLLLNRSTDCLIVGTGPSLDITELENFLRNNPKIVSFSFNSIPLLFPKSTWRPNYYCSIDPLAFNTFNTLILPPDKITMLLSSRINTNYNNKIYFNLSYVNHLLEFLPKCINTGIPFSHNINKVVYDGNTVLYFTLQICFAMGFRNVHLMGIDLDYSQPRKHFINYSNTLLPSKVEIPKMIKSFEKILKVSKKLRIRLINSSSKSKLYF